MFSEEISLPIGTVMETFGRLIAAHATLHRKLVVSLARSGPSSRKVKSQFLDSPTPVSTPTLAPRTSNSPVLSMTGSTFATIPGRTTIKDTFSVIGAQSTPSTPCFRLPKVSVTRTF